MKDKDSRLQNKLRFVNICLLVFFTLPFIGSSHFSINTFSNLFNTTKEVAINIYHILQKRKENN